MWYKDPYPLAYGPKGDPALFLWAELIDGLRLKLNYGVWPLKSFEKGVFKEFVTRTLAIPSRPWKFPAVKPETVLGEIERPMPDDVSYEPPCADEDEPARALDPFPDLAELPGGGAQVPGAGASSGQAKAKRNRSITDLRIAAHGKTPGRGGCSEGAYSHTKECRDRFDSLLGEAEPVRTTKVKGKDHLGLTRPSRERSCGIGNFRRGHGGVVSTYLQAIEEGYGDEHALATKLGMVMQNAAGPKSPKAKGKRKWFVEFCCSDNNSYCQVSEACSIPYLGLTESFGDLTNGNEVVFDQVLYWCQVVVAQGDAIDLWGPLLTKISTKLLKVEIKTKYWKPSVEPPPYCWTMCTSPNWRLLLWTRGGSASFGWPLRNGGWEEDQATQMIIDFNTYSCYRSGCGMGLEIDNKLP